MFRLSLLGYAILAATASGNLRFFYSLPLLGALPTQGSLAAGCSRNRVHAKLEGYGTASEIDLIAGHLWESGGSACHRSMAGCLCGLDGGGVLPLAVRLARLGFLLSLPIGM
jgi:hypothetical protein